MTDRAAWFTAQRVRRLVQVLEGLQGGAPGFAIANAQSIIWPISGGPRQEIESLLSVLVRSGLAQRQSARIFRTRQGQRLIDMTPDRRRREFALLLVRRGWFHDQIRQFLRVARHDGTVLIAHLPAAIDVAPQLVGVLHPLAEFPDSDTLRLRGGIVAEIDSPWSLIPSVMPGESDARLAVGKRGEAYSFQYLRTRSAEPDKILWVAADDETLGHDLEDQSNNPMQRIEVKASVDTDIRFVMSSNEYRHSQEHQGHYTIHFWGGVNLHRDPAREYDTLITNGYPVVFPHVARCLNEGRLIAEPREWLVSVPTGTSS